MREGVGRDVAHDGDAAPFCVEEAVDVAQQHDELRVDERRDHRRELIVVAEGPGDDLVDRDRVVLVQDGDRARLEERAERRARVVRAHAIGEVARA